MTQETLLHTYKLHRNFLVIIRRPSSEDYTIGPGPGSAKGSEPQGPEQLGDLRSFGCLKFSHVQDGGSPWAREAGEAIVKILVWIFPSKLEGAVRFG